MANSNEEEFLLLEGAQQLDMEMETNNEEKPKSPELSAFAHGTKSFPHTINLGNPEENNLRRSSSLDSIFNRAVVQRPLVNKDFFNKIGLLLPSANVSLKRDHSEASEDKMTPLHPTKKSRSNSILAEYLPTDFRELKSVEKLVKEHGEGCLVS